MFIVTKYFFLTIIIFQMTGCTNKNKIADLVLLNGNIITVDSANTITEAIAISGDTIFAIGKNEEIKKFIGDSTKVINLNGKAAIPGFIDSHAHLISTGEALMNLDLSTAKNWDEIISIASQAAEKAKNGEWIIGRGWHQEKWNQAPEEIVEGFPIHKKLSEAIPNNPVLFSHASGHALFANAKAMEISNVTNPTQNPSGGKIIKDKSGFPTGIFLEEAEKLITKKYNENLAKKSKQELNNEIKKAIKLANNECLKNGITTFHDAGESFEDLNIVKNMVDKNEIDIRLYVMLGENYFALKDSLRKYFTIGYGNNHLTVRSIKLYMDGALGSRGAWLLEPYSDIPKQFGMNTTDLNEINSICKIAAENDFQICTHAIGDKANRVTLDVYENIFKNYTNKNFRWRIEHAQHLNPNDISRSPCLFKSSYDGGTEYSRPFINSQFS